MDNMTKTEQLEARPIDSEDLEHRLTLYGIICSKHNQEGDAIWSRFNMIIALNAALLGILTLVYAANPRPAAWHEIGIVVSVFGLAADSWAFYVLHKLWYWHEHWRDTIIEMEKHLPESEGWVKPYSSIPRHLQRDIGMVRHLLFAYTQPLILMFVLAWAVLLSYLLANQL